MIYDFFVVLTFISILGLISFGILFVIDMLSPSVVNNFTKLSFIILIISIVCFMVGMVGVNVYCSQVSNEIAIYSLSDNLGVHGEFSLGSGNVNNVLCYVVLMKNENGYYQTIITSSDVIYINEDASDGTGYITFTHKEYYKISNKHILNLDNVVIHVPENTVITNMIIDGE